MKISDNELYVLCKKYGTAALIWRRKFIALLPEVYKRKLYEKKGFSSIFEFAAKLGGISEEQVRLTLNIERRVEDKPLLKELFNNGTVSINKLARVISVVNKENEHLWAQQIQNILKQEFGTKCSVPICNKPAEEIHHTNRFALSRSHNPYFLAPLCKEHHQIAHSIDTKVMVHRRGAVVYSTAPPI